MNGCEITAAVTAIANFIACNFSSEEISLIGAILNQLGDTLATISVKRDICERNCS